MRIVKLNATPSTNDYLKQLSQAGMVDNFTCVVAENQTQGRGQMGAQWAAEIGKNLTFSVYVENLISEISQIYVLNVAVAVSIFKVLQNNNIPKIAIKWPNDIMADNKKIGGILIENSIRGDGNITSIVGIGLNVNQNIFDNIPTASSLALAAFKFFDKEKLLGELLTELKSTILKIKTNEDYLWNFYKSHLFKKDLLMVFETSDGKKLMGIIKDVNAQGLLLVEHEDDSNRLYNIKEIKMLY